MSNFFWRMNNDFHSQSSIDRLTSQIHHIPDPAEIPISFEAQQKILVLEKSYLDSLKINPDSSDSTSITKKDLSASTVIGESTSKEPPSSDSLESEYNEYKEDIAILESLLDQQDLLHALMARNDKLVAFFSSFKILNKLIDFVIYDYPEYNKIFAVPSSDVPNEPLNNGNNLENLTSTNTDVDNPKKVSNLDQTDDESSSIKSDEEEDEDDEGNIDEEVYEHRAQMAAEILSLDVWDIGDSLVSYPRLLIKLWSVLDHQQQDSQDLSMVINHTNTILSVQKSAYFTKINEHILDMNRNDLIPYIMNYELNLADKMLRHIDNPQIMDFLLKLISSDRPDLSAITTTSSNNQNSDLFDNDDDDHNNITSAAAAAAASRGNNLLLFLNEQNFISKMLDFLDSKNPAVIQTASGDFLKAFITISGNTNNNINLAAAAAAAAAQNGEDPSLLDDPNNNTMIDSSVIGPNELTRELVSEKMMEKLASVMLQGGNALLNGVGIVIEIIRKNNSDYDSYPVPPPFLNGEDDGNTETLPTTLRDNVFLGHLGRVFARKIPQFKRLLLLADADHNTNNNAHSFFQLEKRMTSFGKLTEPLGFDRFKICELVAELLHCSNIALLNDAQGEEIVRQRDLHRSNKVASHEYKMLRAARFEYLEKLRIEEDWSLVRFIESKGTVYPFPTYFIAKENKNNSSANNRLHVAPSTPNASMFDDHDANPQHHEIVSNINRLSLDDDDKDTESVKSIRSEHNKNKRAKVDSSPSSCSSSTSSPDTSSTNTNNVSAMLHSESDESVISNEEEHLHHNTSHSNSHGNNEDEDSTNEIDEVETVRAIPKKDVLYLIDMESIEMQGYVNAALSENPEESEDNLLTGEQYFYDFHGLLSENSYANELYVQQRPYYDTTEKELREEFLVGDQIKISFQDTNIITIIIDFFFRFPWNNFLHNVVYDIVQQILNGPLDVGFNRYLILHLLIKQKCFLLEKILRGYEFLEKFGKVNSGLKLGYVGHIVLISEEVDKFIKQNNLNKVLENLNLDENANKEYEFISNGDKWNSYISDVLNELRVSFNRVLGKNYDEEDDEDGDEDEDEEEDEEDEEDEENDDEEDDDESEDSSKNEDIGNQEDSEYDASDSRSKNNADNDHHEISKPSEKGSAEVSSLKANYHSNTETHGVDVQDHDDGMYEEYIDPNDDGTIYNHPHNGNPKSDIRNDFIDDEEEEDDVDIDDDEDIDVDDDEDQEVYGLSRSRSKGDMNWNEDEQKRLLSMASYIHSNTGGSTITANINNHQEAPSST